MVSGGWRSLSVRCLGPCPCLLLSRPTRARFPAHTTAPSRHLTQDPPAGRRAEPLPVLGRGAGAVVDVADRLGTLEDRLDRHPARSLQHEPYRLRLPPSGAEPVLAARVLEVQVHAYAAVLPDQPARLYQDPLALPQVADEGVARRMQEHQARAALGEEPVHR